jgi:pimeloyl-ACP methyl ester carboxylesterase
MLLHGGGQTRHSWQRALTELGGAGYRAYTLDARGHGESQWADNGDYSIGTQSADLLSVINTFGRPPVLIGASMGGMNSLYTVCTNPEIASALILVVIVLKIEPQGAREIYNFMAAHPDGFETLEDAAAAVAAYTPHRASRSSGTEGLKKNLRRHEDGRWRWHWDPAFLSGDVKEHTQEVPNLMRKLAKDITIPALLVRGQQSNIVSEEGVRDMQQLIPHMEYVDVQGAGHMIAGDKNDAFNQAILEFLSRVQAS